MKRTNDYLNDKHKIQEIEDPSLTIHNSRTSRWLREKHRRYIPSLDGLRAIAVFAVIFYHLGFPWASGGLLGVSVFFVLSGYLITDILLAEWGERGSISLKTFWMRRARRLLPALFFTLAALFIWLLFFRPSMLSSFRDDALAAIFYVSNWWYIFHHLSYFQSYENPSLLTHFWSLGVEEQFYWIWPVFILFAFRHPKIRRYLFVITLVGAVLSAALMAVLYQPGADPSRIYYGTDTRAFSILIGAALAMILPSRKFTNPLSAGSRILLEAAGTLGFIVILAMIAFSNEYDGFIYRGGMFGMSVAAAAVIAAAVHPSTWFGKVLGILPLRWIGVRSYSMYLWQYPIIILSLNNFDAGVPRFARFFVEIVLIIVISTLSLELIENPFRSGAVGRFFKNYVFNKPASVKWRILSVLAASLVIVFACAGVFAQSRNSAAVKKSNAGESIQAVQQKDATNTQVKSDTAAKTRQKRNTEAKTQPVSKTAAVTNNTATVTKKSGNLNQVQALQQDHVTVIGDSIMEDIKPYLGPSFSHITINARVGRQFDEAFGIVSQMKSAGTLGNIVIVELGTNGPVTMSQMSLLIQQIGSKTHIIVTTTRVPRPWQDLVNQTMRQAAAEYPNISLVDWYAASSGHPDYFAPDTVHLNPIGSKIYAGLLFNAVASLTK
ncbi:acyltransferase family protein [Sporolactobacillus pectinivorans]|uniref:acyltransferase family protein n=1 Tax=Sporolactobacillus pectinivorans TaxID=1591408 RepID=UPI000C262C3D|nr:acyltransferase family protein [Sporolactobacillus pectinivorans]